MLGGMRAVVITRPGGPEVLELREVPDPLPGPEELLVRVRAASLNRADLLQRRGLYPAPPGAPAEIPGLEFAGEVEACGPRATGHAPGDRVMGILGGGGQAEKLVLHHRTCMPVPRSLTWEQAAAIPHRDYWPALTTEPEVPIAESLERAAFVNWILGVTARRSAVHDAVARGHRGLKRQPGGKLIGSGTAPEILMVFLSQSGSGIGIAEISAWV